MNVGKTNSTFVQHLRAPVPSQAGRPGGSSEEGVSDDHSQISNLSSYLAAAQSGSPAHLSKLNSLTGAVSRGAYQVDANLISEHIINQSLVFGAA